MESNTTPNIPEKFLSPYDQVATESRIYKMWEQSGFFNPDKCIEAGIADPEKEPFTIILPPPNTTGILHIGHSLMVGVQDVLVRFARMKGHPTLWIPGTDHAAIATDAKVTKLLAKKKINKREIGREKFLEHVDEFVQENRGAILSQTKTLGASLDWSREAFTMDEPRNKAVNTAFKNLYDLGLIYQGDRIVNWDPKGQTVISDDEIVRKEETTKFYYFQYGPFEIGTARPETKFADKYIVVHPDDERYAQYEHMQTLTVEWIDGPIQATVIKDEVADPEMGTGAMTITPWHSQVDFELAQKYDLPREQIINQYGKLLPVAGEFEGMKITEAREKIVEKLDQLGLLTRTEEGYVHQLATAERTGGIIEPQIMKQWWLDVNKEFVLADSHIDGIESGATVTVKKLMQHAVRSGQTKITPSRFEKEYFRWIDNLRDWCLSRQIWFGHQIPVWYHNETSEIHVGFEPADPENWTQDSDVLDTWFSSGLWSFSTLGWPDVDAADLLKYHPTSVLETGYDIIFFWVARMILMSTTLLGQIPFKNVYFHGLVRDENGRKISKSLGNNIDPRDMASKFGSDALRMAQIVGVPAGADNNLGENKVKAYRKFSNKIWNMTRLILGNTTLTEVNPTTITNPEYVEYIQKLDAVGTSVTEHIDGFKLYLAAEELYHFVWDDFAQDILEKIKEPLKSGDVEAQTLALHLLQRSLQLLHPFMPFITEEIWQELPTTKHDTMLMTTSWPYQISQS